MKKIWIASFIVAIALCSVLYAFNPFKKESWEKAGKAIKGEIEKTGKGIGDAVKITFGRSKACDDAKRLGLEWSAKQAEYTATQAGVTLAQKAVESAQKVVNASLDVGKEGVDFSSAFLQLGSDAINKGINIKRVYLSGKITDFKKGAFPEFQIEGIAFGKNFNTKLQLDLSKPADMVKKLIKKIFN